MLVIFTNDITLYSYKTLLTKDIFSYIHKNVCQTCTFYASGRSPIYLNININNNYIFWPSKINICYNYGTVSYTHLDVYKRQSLYRDGCSLPGYIHSYYFPLPKNLANTPLNYAITCHNAIRWLLLITSPPLQNIISNK